jgi:hypothetical protein
MAEELSRVRGPRADPHHDTVALGDQVFDRVARIGECSAERCERPAKAIATRLAADGGGVRDRHSWERRKASSTSSVAAIDLRQQSANEILVQLGGCGSWRFRRTRRT